MAATRPSPGQSGFSAVNLLAAGVHGLLPPLGRPVEPASPPSPATGGLGRIEAKLAAPMGRVRVALSKVDSVATLWITVPFAALFALGCLTLA